MFFITQRGAIITTFKVVYFILLSVLLVSIYLIRVNDNLVLYFFSLGKFFGDASLVLYIITLLPGMGERMSIKNIILSIVRVYRRYIGILMFILALSHLIFIKLLYIQSLAEAIPQALFEGMGSIALNLSFILFIFSNNLSLGKLRIWWYRIQRLTYLLMFFIFLHVALIRFSVWSVAMGVVIVLQLLSFFVVYKKTHSFTGGKPL